jgi:arylformamidase
VKIIDISPEISNELAVWPGDTSFSRVVSMDTNKGDHLGLSKIETTLHLGAHTDAPNHYAKNSQGISDRSLNYYYGACQVIECRTQKGHRIKIEDLVSTNIQAPRVLFKTLSYPDPNNWNEDFCSLSTDLIDFLAEQNVILLGIDTPSIDPFLSKDLEAHHQVHKYNLAILEGIILTQVESGLYTLVALPLKIKEADASPVRAVLIKE